MTTSHLMASGGRGRGFWTKPFFSKNTSQASSSQAPGTQLSNITSTTVPRRQEVASLIGPGEQRSDDQTGTQQQPSSGAREQPSDDQTDTQQQPSHGGHEPPSDDQTGTQQQPYCCSCWRIVAKDLKWFFCSGLNWICSFEHKEEKWLEAIKGSVATIAGLIATMSFAAGIAPPGGVVSVAYGDQLQRADKTFNASVAETGKDAFNPTANITLHGGEAIFGVVFPSDYAQFQKANTLCMYISMFILFLMMSGINLKHRFMVWLCSMLMWGDSIALGFAFSKLTTMINSDNVWLSSAYFREIAFSVWLGGMSSFMVLFTVRMLFWCIRNLVHRTYNEDLEVGPGEGTVINEATMPAMMQSSEEPVTVSVIPEEVVVSTSGTVGSE